jgi:type II secretion system protein H
MTSTTGPNTRCRDGGFTLLELILVLVLVSAALAMAAPSLRRFARGRETSDTAAHLVALARLARSQAAAEARVYRLNIDPEAGTYWLTVQEAGAFVEPGRDYGRLFRFPAGVSVTVQMADGTDQTPCIQFYPDGRCDPATIELRDAETRVLQVACPSASERFRIVTLEEETAR